MRTVLEFDDQGILVFVGGVCKAKDFKRER